MKRKHLVYVLLFVCPVIVAVALFLFEMYSVPVTPHEHKTYMILKDVIHAAKMYNGAHGSPPTSLQEIAGFAQKQKDMSPWMQVSSNGTVVDSRGNGLFYEFFPNSNSATLRSFGSDSKDNKGQGDDIQMTIHFLSYEANSNTARE